MTLLCITKCGSLRHLFLAFQAEVYISHLSRPVNHTREAQCNCDIYSTNTSTTLFAPTHHLHPSSLPSSLPASPTLTLSLPRDKIIIYSSKNSSQFLFQFSSLSKNISLSSLSSSWLTITDPCLCKCCLLTSTHPSQLLASISQSVFSHIFCLAHLIG